MACKARTRSIIFSFDPLSFRFVQFFSSNSHHSVHTFFLYTGCPKNNGTVNFQDFALINSYLFSPCWIEHLFLFIITPRSFNFVKKFLFYEYFLMDCHFRALPLSFHWWVALKIWNSRFFLGLCSDQQLSFLPAWIEHLFLIIITPRSSNLVENFLFYE